MTQLFKPQVGHRCDNFRVGHNQGLEFCRDCFLIPSLLFFEFRLHFLLLQTIFLGRKIVAGRFCIAALPPKKYHYFQK